ANGQGYTPLHIAASVGDSVMVELLLQHGANKAATTTLGKTPLAMAESRAKQASKPSKYEAVIALLKDPNVIPEKHEKNSEKSFPVPIVTTAELPAYLQGIAGVQVIPTTPVSSASEFFDNLQATPVTNTMLDEEVPAYLRFSE
ncbi:MAG: ankyrin repeat domain-containing protein, partial [Gammaproteobacteria bacterium]